MKPAPEGPEAAPALSPRAEQVLLLHRSRFKAVLARRTGSEAAAEDILQAAYVRALERGTPAETDEGIVAWFHGVLRNAWIDHLRRRGAEGRALARHAQEDPAADVPELHASVCECLSDLVPTLRPEYAELIGAVDLAGRPVVEVAGELGITRNNANVRLHRARAALRRELTRTCGRCAEHGCLDCSCRGMKVELGYGRGE